MCRAGLDPVTTDLVVADPERTDKTIGLAVSPDIYAVYLKYIAKEDIHVYSIDEAFMDVTDYLSLYQMTVPVWFIYRPGRDGEGTQATENHAEY